MPLFYAFIGRGGKWGRRSKEQEKVLSKTGCGCWCVYVNMHYFLLCV